MKQQWEHAISYVERTTTLAGARELAASNDLRLNTSVWITAYGKMLERISDTTKPTNRGGADLRLARGK